MTHEFADGVGLDFGVGVDGDDDFCVRLGHGVAKRGGLAAIDLVNDVDARILTEILVEEITGAVNRAVVNDDNAQIAQVGSEDGGYRLHDDAFFVVRGNQHGDGGRRIGHNVVVGPQFFDQRKNSDDQRAPADQHDAQDKDRGDAGAQPTINSKNEAIGAGLILVVALGAVMRLAGVNIFRFLAYLREELTIVLATASSDAVLPQIMRKLEYMGIRKSVVGLVVPTGYSFNLDAFSIYLTLAVVFIAQATNTPLSFGDLMLVLGISLLTSKGAHGMPGSAIVILAATLNAVPAIPAIGLVLVLSIDWFVGMARALGNLIGNCVATVVIAAWENDLDAPLARRVLAGDVTVDLTTDSLPAVQAAE